MTVNTGVTDLKICRILIISKSAPALADDIRQSGSDFRPVFPFPFFNLPQAFLVSGFKAFFCRLIIALAQQGVRQALQASLNKDILVPPNPQIMGALGAAILAMPA